VDRRTQEKVKEEGCENNKHFSNNEIERGGCSLSVLNQGEEGGEEKCQSSTERADNNPM